jgi:hypothetical protein
MKFWRELLCAVALWVGTIFVLSAVSTCLR